MVFNSVGAALVVPYRGEPRDVRGAATYRVPSSKQRAARIQEVDGKVSILRCLFIPPIVNGDIIQDRKKLAREARNDSAV